MAVIIAARGVTISSNFLAGLLETDAIVLHCDDRYQPCGLPAAGFNFPHPGNDSSKSKKAF